MSEQDPSVQEERHQVRTGNTFLWVFGIITATMTNTDSIMPSKHCHDYVPSTVLRTSCMNLLILMLLQGSKCYQIRIL